jgi:hypothetical protein
MRQHRRAVFLDRVLARVEPVERGVDLVRLDFDQEAAMSEVDAKDGDGPLRDESQRAEHRAVAAETDQCVRLIDQLSPAHRLYVVGQARGVPRVGDQLLAVRPRPARELLDDRRRVVARMQDEPQSPSRLERLHACHRRMPSPFRATDDGY